MNKAHLEFLASPDWARMLEESLLPWVARVADLGDDVLEIGPGPGLTTDLLRQRVARVTALELDPDLAATLAARLAGTNVDIVRADATRSGMPSDRFSAAACFSMLHHLPSAEVQDRLFAELHRMLRPSGVLVACDPRDIDVIRTFHEDDTFVPLDPDTLTGRLEAAGFTRVGIEMDDIEIRFSARKG